MVHVFASIPAPERSTQLLSGIGTRSYIFTSIPAPRTGQLQQVRTHAIPLSGHRLTCGGPVPRLSTQPRGSDMGHHTPSPLLLAWCLGGSHVTSCTCRHPHPCCLPHASPLTGAGTFSRKEAGTGPAPTARRCQPIRGWRGRKRHRPEALGNLGSTASV